MIIARVTFDIALSFPGKPVSKDIEPASPSWTGWLFRVVGDRLVITAPAGHIETPVDAVQEECRARGVPVSEAVHVVSEPLSRVRLVLLDDGRPDVIEGPSAALRNQRENAAKATREANEALLAKQELEGSVQPVRRRPSAPKPLSAPPGFRGNPVPPPSPPEEDAP